MQTSILLYTMAQTDILLVYVTRLDLRDSVSVCMKLRRKLLFTCMLSLYNLYFPTAPEVCNMTDIADVTHAVKLLKLNFATPEGASEDTSKLQKHSAMAHMPGQTICMMQRQGHALCSVLQNDAVD